MALHQVWHILVLAAAMFGAAGLAILVLTPLVFDSPPPGLARSRPLVVSLIVVSLALLIVEWTLVHHRSL